MKHIKIVAAFLVAISFALSPLQAAEKKSKGKRPNPFAEIGASKEQIKKITELRKSSQTAMKEARASKNREKMQAAQKEFQAAIAQILDADQMEKYKAVMAKNRKGSKGGKDKKKKKKSE